MISTIDAAGRVVIPKSIRETLRLVGGVALDIRERDGIVEISPLPATLELREGPKGVVAVPSKKMPPLTDDLVRATIERSRR